jgi:hypothetical protein
VSFVVGLPGYGVYSNTATLNYLSGTTPLSEDSNTVVVYYGVDTDGDGLVDQLEEDIGTDPDDADSDDDGVADGDEPDFDQDTDGDGLINALDPDSDGDGILDGTEMGVTDPGADTDLDAGNFVPDSDPSTTTDPLDPDTDGGGVSDGIEDRDHDGAVDEGETDPLDPTDDVLWPDTDGDTIPDDYEVEIGTDPFDADSDDDGVPDGDEPDFDQDTDGDGLINALDPDSDGDGILDGTEMGVTEPGEDTDLTAGHFVPDADPTTTTDPLDPDTDGGGTPDGYEDIDHDGAIDEGECDPLDPTDDLNCEARPADLVATGSGPLMTCAIETIPGADGSTALAVFLAALTVAALRVRRRFHRVEEAGK